VIIGQIVYDITSFLDKHPGGASILLQYAGQDATQAFESFHQADVLTRHLSQEYAKLLESIRRGAKSTNRQHLGLVSTTDDKQRPDVTKPLERKARLSSVINILDFEFAASQNLPPAAFACERFMACVLSA
jgi:L-lactate dehydrogenase (cytochrome)